MATGRRLRTITASFAEGGEQTDVEVLTDLAITGKPAQFGRGVISDVSDKLLDQFLSLRFRAFCRRPRCGPSGRWAPASTCSRSPHADADARFDEADTEQTIELEPVPAAWLSRSREQRRVLTLRRRQPAAPPPTAPPGLRTVPLLPRLRRRAQSELNALSTVVPVVAEAIRPGSGDLGRWCSDRDQDHSTQVVIHWWTARSTRSQSAS